MRDLSHGEEANAGFSSFEKGPRGCREVRVCVIIKCEPGIPKMELSCVWQCECKALCLMCLCAFSCVCGCVRNCVLKCIKTRRMVWGRWVYAVSFMHVSPNNPLKLAGMYTWLDSEMAERETATSTIWACRQMVIRPVLRFVFYGNAGNMLGETSKKGWLWHSKWVWFSNLPMEKWGNVL